MKHVTLLLLLCVMSLSVYSQAPVQSGFKFAKKNSIQLELFGHGLFYSLNYERVVLNGHRFKTTAQAGIAYYPASTGVLDIWIPVVVNELYSFGKHHLELGIGHIFINETFRGQENEVLSRHWSGFYTGRIGYRYQKPEGRFLFRVGFTPIIEYRGEDPFHPVGGATVGWSF